MPPNGCQLLLIIQHVGRVQRKNIWVTFYEDDMSLSKISILIEYPCTVRAEGNHYQDRRWLMVFLWFGPNCLLTSARSRAAKTHRSGREETPSCERKFTIAVVNKDTDMSVKRHYPGS